MIDYLIREHPNIGKSLLYTETYLSLRFSLINQINNIQESIRRNILSGDVDINKHLLPSIERKVKALKNKFENGRFFLDPHSCAEILLDSEKELYPEPLKCCKHFNVEHKDSECNNQLLNDYEVKWIEFKSTDDGRALLIDYITEYICYGLLLFNDYDKTPLSLKALLFNRYCHWNSADTEGFKNWYTINY